MVVSFRVEAKRAARAFERMVIDTQNDLVSNADRYEAVMRSGIDRHFRALSHGGVDGSALGGSVSWSRARHPITMRRRRGRPFPLLDTGNGFLRKGVTTGASAVPSGGARGAATLRYRPRDGRVKNLLAVHQLGQAPLFAGSQGYPSGFTVPKREVLYWDRGMSAATLREVRRAWRESKRRHGT